MAAPPSLHRGRIDSAMLLRSTSSAEHVPVPALPRLRAIGTPARRDVPPPQRRTGRRLRSVWPAPCCSRRRVLQQVSRHPRRERSMMIDFGETDFAFEHKPEPPICACGRPVQPPHRWPLCERCRAAAIARDRAHRARLGQRTKRCQRCGRVPVLPGDCFCRRCATG